LRARLTVSFAVVLAIPLVVAALVVRSAVLRQNDATQRAELRSGFSAAAALYQATQKDDAVAVDNAARTLAARPDVARAFTNPDTASLLASSLRGTLDLVALVRPDGSVAGLSAADPSFLPGAEPPPLPHIVANRPNGWASLSEVRVRIPCGRGCTRLVGSVVGGAWLDRRFVERLPSRPAGITLIVDGVPAASTVLTRSDDPIQLRREGSGFVGRVGSSDVVAARAALANGVPSLQVLVTTAPHASGASVALALGAMMLLALFAGSALAYFLARVHTRPIDELAEAARAVAHGDFDRRIVATTGDELGELAGAFNTMTANLKSYVGQVESSRDELRRSVRLLGETLQSTHDLTKLLSVVLETAQAAVQARAGAVFLVGATRQDLYVKVGRNLGIDARTRVPMGEGFIGWVARERKPVLIPGSDVVAHRSEPQADTAIVVPLESQGQVIGVMGLYGRSNGLSFTPGDMETIASLAQQAAVGVENVLLHQEAQRLSITDGLTGAWNYRYFQMRLAQEVERAIRFGRPFSMMVVDIDHFKRVNDTYGHQRGDSILVEVARRMHAQVRLQVDTLARYGGEEFVLVLPETPLDGAEVVAQKVLESVSSEPFAGEEPVRVTVSIGLATFPDHGTTPRALIRAADMAMYEAKGRGRNRLVTAAELDLPGADDPPPAALTEDSTHTQERP
jgi:diguanylate cyclase (GGDEF)-like protein